MTKNELQNLLIKERIPENYYSLEGGIPNDRMVLSKTKRGWEVYYSERGSRSEIKEFISEKEACEYIYIQIKEMLKH
jgi:hypothetical protein